MQVKALTSVALLSTAGFSSNLVAVELEGFIKHQDIYQQELTDADHHALLSRFLIRHSWQTSDSSNLLLEGISAYDSSYDNQTYSAERNTADIHRLIFKTTLANTSVSLGRHVWSVGNQRQLGNREGTNVRRRFDGVLLDQQLGSDTTLSFYHGYSVKSKAKALDDNRDPDLTASGVIFRQQQLLVHALNYRDKRDQNQDDIYAIETEYRHKLQAFDGFYQLIYQFGDRGPQQISAWFSQLEWAYTVAQHRLSFTASYASGGSSQTTDSHEFQPLFAKAPYYSEAGVFATTNIQHIGLGWLYPVTENFSLGLDVKKLYRVRQDGAIYGRGQSMLLPADPQSGKALANNYSFQSEYKFSPHISLELVASFIDIQTGSNQSPALRNSSFFETMLHYRF